ncbi:MAG: hypothetical protein PQJ59_00020 [Spirochaetales bacterium]|nr:hypothetical protein [Spirochaetales bacterium]
MLTIGLTKKLGDYLGIKKLPPYESPFPSLHSWHANLLIINRKKSILFMHDMSRYSLLLYGIKKSDVKNIDLLFVSNLREYLTFDGYSNDQINTLLPSGEWEYFKTHDRSVLGSMNDHGKLLPFYATGHLSMEGALNPEEGILQKGLIRKLNKTPMLCSKKGFFPKDRLKELL